MSSTEQRLRAVFRSVFELPESVDVSTCNRENTATWDSMAHITLVLALEGEFGVTMDAAESLTLTSYDAARHLLTAAGVSK